MAISYLKKAVKTASSDENSVREVVASMLSEIKEGGEATVQDYAKRFDNYSGEIVVGQIQESRDY